MRDDNPQTSASERFKLFGGFGKPTIIPGMTGGGPFMSVSPDGLSFKQAPTPLVDGLNATIRFDCLPDFSWHAASQRYIGIARGRRPGDLLGCGHDWYPQCSAPSFGAKEKRCDHAVCNSNFRTFALMTSADLKTWMVSLPAQPATKEHQTYTTAAFGFHDVTLATGASNAGHRELELETA